jgi:hypothetical protein
VAARAVSDTLEAAGVEVWFDENELGGGEAWDAKIRNQIRSCTYFMPVISATTEVRREGYFRREWRLAVDRSHDMADDAMFILPVVIDETNQAGARVPEKFLTVQWLKVPGGQATPALTALAARLARGEHVSHVPSRAPFVSPPPVKGGPPPPPLPPLLETPPLDKLPLPPFPSRPADRHDNLKYYAHVITWFFYTLWLLFKRLPKWGRILVLVWLILMAFSRSCTDHETTGVIRTEKAAKGAIVTDEKDEQEAAAALKSAAKQLDQVAADPNSQNLKAGFARAGAELARTVSKQLNPGGAPVKFGVVPFVTQTDDKAARKFGELVIGQVFAQLTLARPDHVQMQTNVTPLTDETTLRSLAEENGEDRLLVAHIEGTDLVVRLLATATPEVVWLGRYPVQGSDVAGVAAQVIQGVLAATTPTPPAPPAKP